MDTPAESGPAPAPSKTASAALIALSDRLLRLQQAYDELYHSHQELQEQQAAQDRQRRESVHELRNAAHAFLSWCFFLRGSPLRETPWFAPLVRAAETVLRRAEEAFETGRSPGAPLPVALSRVDLLPLATDTLESMRPIAEAAGIRLSCATPAGRESVFATADPDRVQQILRNLLQNALAATPVGGRVCVTVWDGAGYPAVEVEDTGPGVPPEVLDLISGGEAGTDPGAMVGLRLSREFAGRMGGGLSVAPPRPDAGARFILRLQRDDT